ncbi:BT1A1 protein, partial [Cochlearius cochlearius]|nr:BT1A1 protein [Cochlearius cochlearius]
VKRMLSGFHRRYSLPAFIICGLVFQVHELQSAPLTVTGPPGPIIVPMGEDVVLPCQFSPERTPREMDVIWFREYMLPFVHRYKGGQDLYGEQMLQYRGRTELLKDGFNKGHVDLKIFHVQLSDRGSYTCFVDLDSDYNEAVVELKVTASGSAPLIALEQYQAGGIQVTCRSAGWYPQPLVLWQDPDGRHLPPLSESVTQDKSGLFVVESSIIVTRGTSEKLSCLVREALQSLERESAFYISDPFFQNARPWMIALGIMLVAVVALLIMAVYLFKVKGMALARCLGKGAGRLSYSAAAGFDGRVGLGNAGMVPESLKVTLDSDTAHYNLYLSEDCRSIDRKDTLQHVPNIPERFKLWCCVLGCEGFTSGRYYWEVEVVDGGGWIVGVCRENVNRKDKIEFKPEEGIWAVGQWEGRFQAFTSPKRTPFPEIRTPKRIRVSLNYEDRQVAFFSVDEEIHIFTFPLASFEDKRVYPWFWVGPQTRLTMVP